MKTKNYLFLFILLVVVSIKTQAQEPKTYHEKMKILMSELDSTKFKNNILYDKVYPLAKLKSFNQNAVKDTSNYKHFIQALHELHLASNKQSFISTNMLNQRTLAAKEQNQVLVGIINVDITTLKEDVLDENNPKVEIDETGQNNKLLEIINKDPYKHIQSLVIAPLQSNTDITTGSGVTFNFLKAFMQKSSNPIKDLSVDFGDGQLHPIIENRNFTHFTVSHDFPSEGTNTLKFTGSYQDGTGFITFARIDISIYPPVNDILKVRATELFTPYEPDEVPYNFVPTNLKSEIDYKIYYSTNPPRNQLLKPIIITDGIDYGDSRRFYEIYDFLLKIGETGEKFGNKLRERGYDVIIANFPNYKIGTHEVTNETAWDEYNNPIAWETEEEPFFREGGADYIQRNAKVFKELINKINTKLTLNDSTEELVVIGPSMGGLVTRWALKEMEDTGVNHNVRLWVSFDAPQQGANIPPSIQLLSAEFDETAALVKLNKKAAKQMLLRHYLDESNNTIDEGAPNYRNRFKNELTGIDYPQNLRKVAMVNGTAIGENINTIGSMMADLHMQKNGFDVLHGYLYHSGYMGNNRVLSLDYTTIAEAWGYDDVEKFSYSSNGSLDNAPGCYIPLIGDFSLNRELEKDGATGLMTQSVDQFTFMSTKSTLDFQGSSQILHTPFCDRDLVATGETPFDSYYAPTYNQEHVELNQTNVDWFLAELDENPEPPFVYCLDDLEIEGPNQLCGSDQAYYTSNYGSVEVTWVSDNGFIIVDQDSAGIWIERDPAYAIDYNGTISVYLSYTTTTKTIGCMELAPLFAFDYTDTTTIDIILQDVPTETPINEQAITDVTWELTSGNASLVTASDEMASVYGTNFTGIVTLTNAAGSTTHPFFWPDPNTCYALQKVGSDRYQVLDRCNNNEVINTLPIKELYDIYGNKISDIPINNQELDINTIGNNGAIHVLHIVVNGQNLSKIIVKD